MCPEARHGTFQSISNSAYLISATWDNLIKKKKEKEGNKNWNWTFKMQMEKTKQKTNLKAAASVSTLYKALSNGVFYLPSVSECQQELQSHRGE